MNSLARTLGLAFVLLLIFLATSLAIQAWLDGETTRLQAEAVAIHRAQFEKALELTRRPVAQWDEDYLRELGALIGGTVTLRDKGRPMTEEPPGSGLLRFSHPLPPETRLEARVSFFAPAAGRLVGMHQRMLATIVLLALFLVLIPVLVILFRRPVSEGGSTPPWRAARTEMQGLEHFARMSVERGAELERELGARRRAEEDLLLSRTLLGQSLEERVRLGRDLHDSLSQSLYAISLTLESVRKKLGKSAPAELPRRLDQCIAELRRLNQEVRAYIRELEPATLQRQSFREALTAMLDALPVDESAVRIERRIDAESAALILPEQTAEVINIVREAISNSLRHSKAQTLVVRIQRGDDAVALAVQDDGTGFDFAAGDKRGHGLENIRSRAEALGGSLQIVSTPGKGTRVSLTLPIIASPP